MTSFRLITQTSATGFTVDSFPGNMTGANARNFAKAESSTMQALVSLWDGTALVAAFDNGARRGLTSREEADALAMLARHDARPQSVPAPTYTLDAGRTIVRNGVPVATLQRVQEPPSAGNAYVTGLYTLSPAEADDFAGDVVAALNATAPGLLAALRTVVKHIACYCEQRMEPGQPCGTCQARAAIAKAEGRAV